MSKDLKKYEIFPEFDWSSVSGLEAEIKILIDSYNQQFRRFCYLNEDYTYEKFNLLRQYELEKMFGSYNYREQVRFEEILGHKINWNQFTECSKWERAKKIRNQAISEIADREHWTFLDFDKFCNEWIQKFKDEKYDLVDVGFHMGTII